MEIENQKLNIYNRRYLGSKTKLLAFIDETLKKENIKFSSFCDLFGGTGVVSDYFFRKNKKIIINDMLESNRVVYNTFFGSMQIDNDKISKLINKYNNISNLRENYFSKNFSDTFFSKENCKKIGFIREDIARLHKEKSINDREKDYLISSLLFSMDKIANTVGHYDAYRRNGDLSANLILREFNLYENKKLIKNEIYKEDSNYLADKIIADIVYLDPPYNSRQYCDAYHLLENVATWKKPEVFGVARKMDRSNLKSQYCEKSAPRAFKELVDKLDCKYIVVSYNNMGLKGAGRSQAKISDEEIISILKSKGEVSIYETDFAQFTTGKTHIEDHKERLFICKVGTKINYELNEKTALIKSPLNYTGGKYKLLPQLFAKFPKQISSFVDVFGGGFNVGANVDCKNIIYNDICEPLVNLLKMFYSEDGIDIINNITSIVKKYNLSDSDLNGYEYYNCNSNNGLGPYNKEKYIQLRNDYNKSNNIKEKNYLLLCLIIYGFNNQIRFNSYGDFNIPVGKRDFNSKIRKNVLSFSNKIKEKKIEFFSKDFTKLDINNKDSFIYCDPPYTLGDASYNENGLWSKKSDLELFDFLDKANRNGNRFALSNVIEHKGKTNKALIDWALANKYNIIYIKKDYKNSNYHIKNKNANTIEVLITNY